MEGALNFRSVKDAFSFFNISVDHAPTDNVLLSLAAQGTKPAAGGRTDSASWRPYYIVVCGDSRSDPSVIVGKLMESLISSHYRGTVFRASECEVRPDSGDGLLFHLLRARPPPGEKPMHFILQTRSQEARDKAVARLRTMLIVSPSAVPTPQAIPGPTPLQIEATVASNQSSPENIEKLRPHAARLHKHGLPASSSGPHLPPVTPTADVAADLSSTVTLQDRLRELEASVRTRRSMRGSTVPSESAAQPNAVIRRVDVDRLPAIPPRSDVFAPGDADAKHRYAVYSELMETEIAYVRKMQVRPSHHSLTRLACSDFACACECRCWWISSWRL